MPWLTGYPRENVNWHPSINPEKCVVGCTNCTILCLGNAISHPDIGELRALYKKEGIWTKVKKKMEEDGKLIIGGNK